MSTANLFETVKSLRKEGRIEEALAKLRDALRRRTLGPQEVDRAGRMIRKELDAGRMGPPLDVLLAGQCTTSWVATALTAAGWAGGLSLRVAEGGYDNVLQELHAHAARQSAPAAVILLPWHGRLLEGAGAPEQRLEDELAFWRQAWALAAERLRARIVQVGYDWIHAGPLGRNLSARNGPVDLVRRTNEALRAQLPNGAIFVDLEQVSGDVGRNAFYDPRRYYWTKQPFSESGACHLAGSLFAAIRALHTGPKKVLVLDLDNTLWGGVVGETGPLGIALGDSPDGEAFRAFQKYARQLTQRGVLLAVASKNNPQDAREPFEVNPDMVLRLEDIAAFEACWEPKSQSLVRIAAALNLGLDSFVFFDDNPAEREHVRQALPEVEVVEVPPDPAEYVRALEAGHWFEAVGLTKEDQVRAEQYAVERRRRELQTSCGSMDDYLRSLEMVADVRGIEAEDLQRVVQLLAKTNQFNFTTRRHSQDEVVRLCGLPGAVPLTMRLRDRFGDHGLVSVLIAVPDDEDAGAMRIDTWLMSCRVISRTAEQFLLGCLLERCRETGFRRIIGEFIPTKKNGLVAGVFVELGFAALPDRGDGVQRFELKPADAVAPKTFVSGGGVSINHGERRPIRESQPTGAPG